MATDSEESRRARERRLHAVLDRQIQIDSLPALVNALHPQPQALPLQETAIGFDANVFLRLASHRKSADIFDYLMSKHDAPIILPGQAIQEFWNNQLQAVESIAAGVKKHFDQLKTQVLKIDPAFGDFAERFQILLAEFSGEFGYTYDEGTVHKTRALLELLQSKADVSYASRSQFFDVCMHRKRTKTPPGFRDDGDGDFYVWVDLLTGVQKAQEDVRAFSRLVFVSHDRKIDWTREGVPHPILVSEVQALAQVPFEIWTIDRFAEQIASAIS